MSETGYSRISQPFAPIILSEHNQAQRDRLSFIELRVRFIGEIKRSDLIARFGIQTAAATRDFAIYKELAPGNIDYDAKAKKYILGPNFSPIFNYPLHRLMSLLTDGFGDGEPLQLNPWTTSETCRLAHIDMNVLASITRSIHQHSPIKCTYYCPTSGKTEREIVPFSLIDNGSFWNVRAFDRHTAEFRDFFISRIENPVPVFGHPVSRHEKPDHDIQWSRIVEIQLVPHPDQPHPEITERDYGMSGGVVAIKVRASMVVYLLRRWNVDCSPDHSLRGPEYRLWLRDHLTIYGVENAVLAPGYRFPNRPDINAATSI